MQTLTATISGETVKELLESIEYMSELIQNGYEAFTEEGREWAITEQLSSSERQANAWNASVAANIVKDLEDAGVIGPLEWVPTPHVPFKDGDHVLYAPTGQWATVISCWPDMSAIMWDGTSVIVDRPTGDLIYESNVDPDPDFSYEEFIEQAKNDYEGERGLRWHEQNGDC